MVERLGMKLAVVIGAREREMQRYAVALIDRDGDGALHLVDVGVGQDPALDSGEAPPGLPAFIVDRDRPAIGGDRSVDLSRRALAVAECDPVMRAVGVALREPVVDGARFRSEEHTAELRSLMRIS